MTLYPHLNSILPFSLPPISPSKLGQEAYLSDLQTLERARLIQRGCHVAADNVVVFGIDDYRHYVQQLADAGVVDTHLRMGHLEYVDLSDPNITENPHWKDGLECPIYRKDPPPLI